MNIKLILGLGCNMQCSYCYQRTQHDNQKEMSLEVIDKIIERIKKLKEPINLCLFGGEPLLYKDKILYLLKQIKGLDVSLSMTTNAFDRAAFYEIREFWGNPISVLLSNKEHKNYNKLGESCSFRWVATPQNINELTDELIEFLVREYEGRVDFKYYMSEKWQEEDIDKLHKIKAKFMSYCPDFTMELPFGNAQKKCYSKEIVINWNGDYLVCHRNLNSTTKENVFNAEFKEPPKTCCVAMNTSNLDNLYSDNQYKFRGINVFSD